jgi:glycosyltransferase involved in cell wall biosynthesis
MVTAHDMSTQAPKLSIITAVHNQLPMNQIYWENLTRNTKNTFELIVIDNASTDKSANFFESVGASVIRNSENYSYPASQNQGIAIAKGEWLAFLNNDIIVSPEWDETLILNALHNQLDVITSCGIEHVEDKKATKKLRRRWNRIRGLTSLFGTGRKSLLMMHKWMYGDWVAFTEERKRNFKNQAIKGFVGNTVMFSRRGLEILGPWDETQQAADFDLFLRTAIRAREVGDIRPMHIALDCFNHHYIRLTLKGGYPPFIDADKLIPFDKKWSLEDRALLEEI